MCKKRTGLCGPVLFCKTPQLIGVDDNTSRTDGLVKAIIVNHILYFVFFIPYLDAEGIRFPVQSPEHELVFSLAINGTGAFVLCPGIISVNTSQS